MKKHLFIILATLFLGIASTVAAQDFNTSSTLMNSGSQYAPSVSAVGASSVYSEEPSEPAQASGRAGFRKLGGVTEDEDERSEESPVGEPWIMLLFAAIAGGVVFYRQKRANS